jgi:hypothetical protein
MRRTIILSGAALLVLLPLAADAQGSDPSAQLVGWVCSNQATVSWLLGFLLAHLGLSTTSAILKKLGVTDGSATVQIIRFLALDLKPTPAAIVAEADQIKAQGKA